MSNMLGNLQRVAAGMHSASCCGVQVDHGICEREPLHKKKTWLRSSGLRVDGLHFGLC
jgi:hypothetical protein